MTDLYRFHFGKTIPAGEVETTLLLSLFGVEALHGEARARLDARHAFDRQTRTVVIAADTPVGLDLNKLFLGFLTREFGPGSFHVERLERAPEPNRQPDVATA